MPGRQQAVGNIVGDEPSAQRPGYGFLEEKPAGHSCRGVCCIYPDFHFKILFCYPGHVHHPYLDACQGVCLAQAEQVRESECLGSDAVGIGTAAIMRVHCVGYGKTVCPCIVAGIGVLALRAGFDSETACIRGGRRHGVLEEY